MPSFLRASKKVSSPKRPDNFTGLWINRHGTNARTEQEYLDGIPNGAYRSILENGIIHREGQKKGGLWHGTLIVRNSRGEILDISPFIEGTGIYHIFNCAGQMTDEVPLVHGKAHGIVRCWRFGKLAVTRFFEHGTCTAAVCEA